MTWPTCRRYIPPLSCWGDKQTSHKRALDMLCQHSSVRTTSPCSSIFPSPWWMRFFLNRLDALGFGCILKIHPWKIPSFRLFCLELFMVWNDIKSTSGHSGIDAWHIPVWPCKKKLNCPCKTWNGIVEHWANIDSPLELVRVDLNLIQLLSV